MVTRLPEVKERLTAPRVRSDAPNHMPIPGTKLHSPSFNQQYTPSTLMVRSTLLILPANHLAHNTYPNLTPPNFTHCGYLAQWTTTQNRVASAMTSFAV
jgi:hypothetical protein